MDWILGNQDDCLSVVGSLVSTTLTSRLDFNEDQCLMPTTLTKSGHPFVEVRVVRRGGRRWRGRVLDRRRRRRAEEEVRFWIADAVHFGAAEYR
jgi:hypothetical protein